MTGWVKRKKRKRERDRETDRQAGRQTETIMTMETQLTISITAIIIVTAMET